VICEKPFSRLFRARRRRTARSASMCRKA
jgi:hypothetical protein